ncbi:hypothetical protein HN51_054512 [Arachis hypogaea]
MQITRYQIAGSATVTVAVIVASFAAVAATVVTGSFSIEPPPHQHYGFRSICSIATLAATVYAAVAAVISTIVAAVVSAVEGF